MSKIEVGRYANQLRRMFGMAGSSIVSAELSPEISPTVQLEGPVAEWEFLKGVRLAGSGQNITAGAVNPSSIRLLNPVGSGCIATVTRLLYSTSGIQQMSVFLGGAAVNIGAVVATGVRDSRWNAGGATGQNALILSITNSGGVLVGQRMYLARTNPDLTVILPTSYVLLPGDNLDVSGFSNNTAIQASFEWSERGLPELEA